MAENKPPIGLMHKNIWESMRFAELQDAIRRYLNANMALPEKWVEEYNEFTIRMQ